MKIRTRFAPSPTGYLHIGNIWVAFLNWLFTRQNRGSIILRIEDIDGERSKLEYIKALKEDLEWLGLDWDEGPGFTYSYGSTIQSERLGLYKSLIHKWGNNGDAYPCYCTRARIHKIASAPHRGEQLPIYDGYCRNTLTTIDEKHKIKPSWRFKIKEKETVSFSDIFHKKQYYNLMPNRDDFVIMRADGMVAYQLAVSYDDGAMDITHVFRGEDLLSSTFYQIKLLKELGYQLPVYGHLPLLVDKEGIRLSKRQKGITIRSLRNSGITVNDIIGKLLFWAGAISKPEKISLRYAKNNISFNECHNLTKKTISI